MIRRSNRLVGAGLVLLMAGLACGLPGNGGQEDISDERSVEEIQTQAVETVVAELTELASISTDPTSESAESGSDSPTVSVSKDTNCRSGPNTIYNLIKVVLVGDVLVVVGQYPGGPYVIVDLGDGTECWLWLEYATIIGDISGLLAYSSPPPPVAAATSTSSIPFVLTHYDFNECGNGVYMAIITIQNNSSDPFKSAYVKLIHLRSGGGTHSMFTETNDAPFLNDPYQCPGGNWNYLVPGASELAPGGTAYISLLANQRSSAYGENVEATVKVCTRDDLKGQCYEMVVVFQLPAQWGQ